MTKFFSTFMNHFYKSAFLFALLGSFNSTFAQHGGEEGNQPPIELKSELLRVDRIDSKEFPNIPVRDHINSYEVETKTGLTVDTSFTFKKPIEVSDLQSEPIVVYVNGNRLTGKDAAAAYKHEGEYENKVVCSIPAVLSPNYCGENVPKCRIFNVYTLKTETVNKTVNIDSLKSCRIDGTSEFGNFINTNVLTTNSVDYFFKANCTDASGQKVEAEARLSCTNKYKSSADVVNPSLGMTFADVQKALGDIGTVQVSRRQLRKNK